MSDCGVCLYSDIDEPADDFEQMIIASDGTVKCDECRKLIPSGQDYEKTILYYGYEDEEDEEGERKSEEYETCLACADISEAFSCAGRVYGGFLWESMYEVMGELNSSCFDRLKTPAGKAELQRRWMEWKGLA